MRARTSLLIALPLLGIACSRTDHGGTRVDSGAGAAAATATESDPREARQAIDAAKAKYIAAVERGDTLAIAASFTDSASVVFPAGPPAVGKAALTRAFADMLSRARVNRLEGRRSGDLMVSGDLAVETGAYEIRTQPTAGREAVDKGQYLIVWRRDADGAWKMACGFNRSDAPLR